MNLSVDPYGGNVFKNVISMNNYRTIGDGWHSKIARILMVAHGKQGRRRMARERAILFA